MVVPSGAVAFKHFRDLIHRTLHAAPLNIYESSPYRKENNTLQHYKDEPVNAVQGDNRCLC
jgi:hypothetical protein